MSSIIRSPHLILIPALVVALGCASISPAPEAKDSSVEISEVSATFEPVYFGTNLAALSRGGRAGDSRFHTERVRAEHLQCVAHKDFAEPQIRVRLI